MFAASPRETHRIPVRTLAIALAAAYAGPALAQQDLRSAPIVVSATRTERSSFDLPTAIDALGMRDFREAKLGANVSEVLPKVPGVYIQNRETYAQEQQITVRGFGARSQFGTRGVKILIDGVPASTPDGQGGSANIDFASAERIEVLRGPFSALYGNHSGGVVQVFTEDGPKQPTVSANFTAGSYDTQKYGLKAGGRYGNVDAVISTSYLTTNGYREHSASERSLTNVKLGAKITDQSKLTVVANYFDQPLDQDPQTLSAAQVAQNPRQVRAAAYTFNTRRSLDNQQVGLVFDHDLSAQDSIRLMTYGGQRNNVGYLSTPLAQQNAATSAGGVSAFSRDFAGLGGRWARNTTVFGGQRLSVTTGADYDVALEARKGYLNNNGLIGALKRNEDNRVHSWGAYSQAEWQPLPKVSLSAGLRYTQVAFSSKDYFIATGNGDDSGSARYSAWTPVIGALVRVTPLTNVYMNAGRSFETPTFIELSYRNSGSGLNFALRPATSNHYEIGVKSYVADAIRVTGSVFQIYTNGEIVVDSAAGGRTVYRNAGRTERTGLELSGQADLGYGLSLFTSYTYLKAVFADPFQSSLGGTVASGSQVPGIPRSMFYADAVWRHEPSGFYTGLEGRYAAKVYANDLNTAAADSYTVADFRVGIQQQISMFDVSAFARLNNLFNENYIGALAVNDTNGFFYAPAPTRNYLIGVSGSLKF
ncbi:MAG: TonB-dependent receptor [Burkholderiales bacterium]